MTKEKSHCELPKKALPLFIKRMTSPTLRTSSRVKQSQKMHQIAFPHVGLANGQ